MILKKHFGKVPTTSKKPISTGLPPLPVVKKLPPLPVVKKLPPLPVAIKLPPLPPLPTA